MIKRKEMKYEALPLPDRVNFTDEEMLLRASSFHDQMKRRHTVREFNERNVPRQIIVDCIKAAGTAPSGANHQPWHFAAVSNLDLKRKIRFAAEEEERQFYAGGGGDEWIKALEPIGTNAEKPHLEIAPWLLVVFAQRWGYFSDGSKYKNYYVPESVGIATGVLLTALHNAGLVALTHTPNPMTFLNEMFARPSSEKPTMIIAVGHPADNATVPAVAKIKKDLPEILTLVE